MEYAPLHNPPRPCSEFGFPVFAIANVREIFEAGQHIETADGTAYVTDEIKAAADAYLKQYGA